jgi:hypothetical protein
MMRSATHRGERIALCGEIRRWEPRRIRFHAMPPPPKIILSGLLSDVQDFGQLGCGHQGIVCASQPARPDASIHETRIVRPDGYPNGLEPPAVRPIGGWEYVPSALPGFPPTQLAQAPCQYNDGGLRQKSGAGGAGGFCGCRTHQGYHRPAHPALPTSSTAQRNYRQEASRHQPRCPRRRSGMSMPR